jgi:hypothetical protein
MIARRSMAKALLLLALAASVHAADQWKISVVSLAASQAADAASSYGYPEANRLYGARFAGRWIAIKAGIAVATPLIESRMMRRHPGLRKAFALFNFGTAAATAAAAAYNATD